MGQEHRQRGQVMHDRGTALLVTRGRGRIVRGGGITPRIRMIPSACCCRTQGEQRAEEETPTGAKVEATRVGASGFGLRTAKQRRGAPMSAKSSVERDGREPPAPTTRAVARAVSVETLQKLEGEEGRASGSRGTSPVARGASAPGGAAAEEASRTVGWLSACRRLHRGHHGS